MFYIAPFSLRIVETDLQMMSRWDISHTTDIDAPIELAWDQLVDINSWDWNLWTRLEADEVKTGTRGKLKAPIKGEDREWED
jgi:hypothetical protein